MPPPDASLFDQNHGLIVGDLEFNKPPCVINDFLKPNAGRNQVTVTLPGSSTAVPALDALNQWIKFAVRVPNGPLTDEEIKGGVSQAAIDQGRQLFKEQQCTSCHRGGLWTVTVKDFTPPPAATDIFCETVNAGAPSPPSNCGTAADPTRQSEQRPVPQPLPQGRWLVQSRGRRTAATRSATTSAVSRSLRAVVAAGVLQPQQDALGIDYNGDKAGIGFGVSSLLGIYAARPTCTTAPARPWPAWSAT